MKEFISQEFYGNTIFNWAISLAYIVGAIILAKILYLISGKIVKRITAKTKSRLDDILVDMLEEPVVFAVIIGGLWLGINRLHVSEGISAMVGKVYIVLITLNVTWLIHRVLISIIDEYIKPLTEKTESDFDDQVFPIIKKGIKGIIWILGIVVALNNAGYNVGALIAGLGIGGLAMAMAAKDTVSNIFGGFTIFTDKPFKMGDRVRIGGFDGNVVEIGLRSTRLRTLDGTIVTIPNLKVTDSLIENVSLEPTRKITLKLGLTYNTTPEQMEEAILILKNIAENNDSVTNEYKSHFINWGDFSLGIVFIYYIKKEADISQTQSDINLAILKEFNKKGLQFAFPTQTIILDK